MLRAAFISSLGLLVSACTTLPQWFDAWPSAGGLQVAPAGDYRFDWELSGDPEVAPLQIFDDGRQIWMQFPAGDPIPAVFGDAGQGQRLLLPRAHGDYHVVQGSWPVLLFRGGRLQARAARSGHGAIGADSTSGPVTGPTPAAYDAAAQSALSEAAVEPLGVEPDVVLVVDELGPDDPLRAESGPAERALAGADQDIRNTSNVTETDLAADDDIALAAGTFSAMPDIVELTASSFRENPVPDIPLGVRYDVGPDDGNLRIALGRWARLSDWTFAPEHWTVDVDIPISAQAVFGNDFEHAVQGLLATTELGDRPLQPCFYSNRVLRVVPYAQACDRARAGSAS